VDRAVTAGDATLPTIAVVIPAYNREATVERTVTSVCRAVEQLERIEVAGEPQRPSAEVIVVDDGSADGTAAVAEAIAATDRHVRVLRQTNAGVSAARNAGARAARARTLVFLDCDDAVDPHWLVALLGHDEPGSTRPDLAFCSVRRTHADGRVDELQPEPLGPAFGGITGHFLPGLFTVDREVFLRAGGYAVGLRFSENTELGLRLTAELTHGDRPISTRVIPEALVTFTLPDVPGGSNAYTDRNRFESALYLLDTHRDRLALDPPQLATYWAIAGVAAARMGRSRESARCFVRAARADLREPRHAGRFAISLVPPLRRRLWPSRAD
jgi:glycosyltransferase involved in cell wall biosynthesis